MQKEDGDGGRSWSKLWEELRIEMSTEAGGSGAWQTPGWRVAGRACGRGDNACGCDNDQTRRQPGTRPPRS